MKVIHIESGLGNQMLDYCDLLASKKVNPLEEHYIETIIYDIHKSHEKICMWNGYELENVFGIQEKNVKTIFNHNQWKQIIEDVEKSRFWEKGWAYSDAITDAFGRQGLKLFNLNQRKRLAENLPGEHLCIFEMAKGAVRKSSLSYLLRKAGCFLNQVKGKRDGELSKSLKAYCDDAYTGHYLQFMFKGSGIEQIEDKVRKSFIFPKINDSRNSTVARKLQSENSVALHVRRGDFLSQNSACYTNGYFVRAVKFIRKKISNPVFYIFCDEDTTEWVKMNIHLFGLTGKDYVVFIDWNRGQDSFRDMHLMSLCRHNIVTNSSFGWWASYLNLNPDKITCSPHPRILTTNWF